MSRQEVTDAVHKALSAVGMQDFMYQPTGSLSGGQKQRVCLAGALAQDAQVSPPCLLVCGIPHMHASMHVCAS